MPVLVCSIHHLIGQGGPNRSCVNAPKMDRYRLHIAHILPLNIHSCLICCSRNPRTERGTKGAEGRGREGERERHIFN